MFEIVDSILITSIFIFFVMTLAWWICIKIKNFGYVDFVWSGSFSLVAILLFFKSEGFIQRKLFFTAMVVFWSLRLASHLFTRLTSHHPHEDVRYVQLRADWKENLNFKFFLFFQFQAVTVVLLTLPFYFPMQNATPQLNIIEWLAVIIWIIAVGGETLSDKQLKKFKLDPLNKGKVCQTGLWKYSRHPNYFFEWLIWVSYFVYCCASPGGWVALYLPGLMFLFLYKVTGIPITEELSLKNRGEAYRDYQRRTSMFFPWFPKQ